MAIRIVTDSTADLPPSLAAELNITVVPASVILDDVAYRDGIDLTPDQFYAQLLNGSRLPTTSQPSVGDFQSAYRELAEQGHSIISLHISGKLSGTANSAGQAKAALGDSASVEIVDTGLASIGLLLVIVAASSLAGQSDSLAAVAGQVRQNLDKTRVVFALDTLEYLQKGGRIGKAQAFVGSLLSVKPVLTLHDGEVHPLEKPRNHQRAMGRLEALTRQRAPAARLAIAYSTEQSWAEELRDRLSDLVPPEQIIMSRFGPSLGVYVGPRAVGVAITSAG